MPAGAPRPNLLALALSAVPGLGHLVLGRSRRGYLFFMAGTAAWNLLFLAKAVKPPPVGDWAMQVGTGVGAAVSLYSVYDVFRVGVWCRLPHVAARRDAEFQQAVGHFRRRELPRAREILDTLLDLDPADPVTRLYLAALERSAGHFDRAIHHARKALRADPSTRWREDIEYELRLARKARHGRS